MEGDMSKSVVILLIVLTLIVSIAGTWIVSEKLDIETREDSNLGNDKGNIAFRLVDDSPNTGTSSNVGLIVTE